MTVYQKIEQAIIRWNNDGTETAGTLTREILKIIEDEKAKEHIQKDDHNKGSQQN